MIYDDEVRVFKEDWADKKTKQAEHSATDSGVCVLGGKIIKMK